MYIFFLIWSPSIASGKLIFHNILFLFLAYQSHALHPCSIEANDGW